ncbi:hypothetical protein PLICRDRAFT_173137 [Plicaturopsis crispa FD-325 SS-3]|nr:hypothetical protein PLICRDRAFT_173137 [Plicaturopsis crispa FD-325 SS-3]
MSSSSQLDQENLLEVFSGGTAEWMHFDDRKLYTNAFIFKEDQILLGYKKRGFGIGKYNGFGGKVDAGETPAQAAARELHARGSGGHVSDDPST